MTPERIRALRRSLGLTQAEFAQAMAANLRTVTYWEAGDPRRRPTGPALILMHLLERNPKRLRVVQAIASEVAQEREHGGD